MIESDRWLFLKTKYTTPNKSFCSEYNEPAYPAKIEDDIRITKKTIGKSCKKLKKQGILLSKFKYAENHGDTHYYYLDEFADVLNYLHAHGSKSLINEMIETEYYITQIPNLIDYFDNKRILAGHKVLSSRTKEVVQICLKYSWKTLYVVLGIYDFDELSIMLTNEYKTFTKHLTEGRFISVSTINIAIDETKIISKEEKKILKSEIYAKAAEDLDLRYKHTANMVDNNAVPLLFEQFLFDDPILLLYTEEEEKYEQFTLDIKRVNFLVNDIIDPSLNPSLAKDENDRYANWPCIFSNNSSFSRLH